MIRGHQSSPESVDYLSDSRFPQRKAKAAKVQPSRDYPRLAENKDISTLYHCLGKRAGASWQQSRTPYTPYTMNYHDSSQRKCLQGLKGFIPCTNLQILMCMRQAKAHL